MATIRPADLPAAATVVSGAALIVDSGSVVEKATPAQVVDAAIPLASQAEAEAGTNNTKRVTPLRVAQAIDALGVSASNLSASAGAELIGFNEGGTGAADMTLAEALRRGALYTSDYGVEASNTAANNVTALLNLIDRAQATGKVIIASEPDIYLDANIPVPVGVGDIVSIMGMARSTGFIFTGTAVDKGFYFYDSTSAPGDYDMAGGIMDLWLKAQAGAKRAATFKNCSSPIIDRNRADQFDGCAFRFEDVIFGGGSSRGNLIVGCANATECAVEITGTDTSGLGSTSLRWENNYISGGEVGGGTTRKGGMSIDRCADYAILGGAIESTGIPLILGGATSSTIPLSSGEIGGGIDLENPGDGNPYIDIGQGWAGTTNLGIQGLQIGHVDGSPSGTTDIPYAIRAKHTLGFERTGACRLGQSGTPTSANEFVGTTNTAPIVRMARRQSGETWPWVRENSVMRADATPLADWFGNQIRAVDTHLVSSGTSTPSVAISGTQGGIYSAIYFSNVGATNITNITFNGAVLPIGTRIAIYGDGNSTLKHNAGGTSPIVMRSGADLLLTATQAAIFVSDGTRLRQLA